MSKRSDYKKLNKNRCVGCDYTSGKAECRKCGKITAKDKRWKSKLIVDEQNES